MKNSNDNESVLHMIGNAHLDPVWLWRWQEGFQETKATFRSALDRISEDENFIFTCSSAAAYEWIENNEPGMFEEIKQRVKEGRWEIVGGWWVQADCNLPSGESLARQALYAQRYFKEKFGVTAKVGYNVDSFGHNAMLPQILKKSGMDYYVFMRPSPQEKGLPGRLFWWESDDYSRVLAYRIPFEYNTWGKDVMAQVNRHVAELKAPLNELMCFYGVGNHGGGPTKENIKNIYELDQNPDYPKLKFSSPNLYFSEIEKKSDLHLPVVHDDLQHHASGCYSVHSGIKKWNREGENALISAEKYSTIANWLTGQPYPDNYHQAWKNVLFNQFHDILPGTSIEAAYEDAQHMHGEAMAIAARGKNYALQSLSWRIGIDEEQDMVPLVIFNPHSWDSKVNVEFEVGKYRDDYVMLDENDSIIPYQKVQSKTLANGRHRISFIAQLPSLGYRVYRFARRPETQVKQETIIATDTVLENKTHRVKFDPETGYMTSIFDKERDIEFLAGPAACPVVTEDKSDTWGHNKLHFNKVIGKFKAKSIKLVEHGSVKSVIRVVSEYNKSTLVQEFAMYKDLEQIDVQVTVNWQEQFNMLKLLFPVDLIFRKCTYEIPYGHIERENNGEEEPGQNWFDVSGTHEPTKEICGLSILNDGKYSFSIENKQMAMTVLKSSIYAHHDPAVPEEEGFYSFIDQGIQKFNYTLLPHRGNWETAGTVKKAWELNQKPEIIIETYHKGKLPQTASFVEVDQDNIIISAVKKAEDNEDIIIRCYETTKVATHASIKLPHWNRTIEADFKPCEIKTFRVPKNEELPITETNLIEW